MNKKYPFLFLFIFILFSKTNAQPSPCVDPAAMTPTCEDACIICDIDGFQGRHDGSDQGVGPSGFCTVVQHNIRWIGFIAGSVDLEISLAVSNCVNGGGLEIGIYEAIDCQNFQQVSQCWGAQSAVQPNTSKVFSNTQPLVIGQYYYLVMDGAFGDNCDWEFTVVSGDTRVDPLDTSGDILGNLSSCPNLVNSYIVNSPIGATDFDWTINGNAIPVNNDTIDYTFLMDGTYNLCVTASNVCDEAPPTCTTVIVTSVSTTEIVDILCQGDSFEIANTVIYQGGFYEFMLQNVDGCDSLVTLDLEELVTPLLNLDVDICDGDTLYVGNTPYTQTGIYQENLTSVDDCDSIVILDLFTIVCNITSIDNPIPAVCFGENSGMIEFNVVNGTAPFTYIWQDLNNLFSGSGNISATGETVLINNIPKGTYIITIEDNFGNSDIIISDVTEPPVMALDFISSNYNGSNLSCDDSSDGTLEVIATGGVPNYIYDWQNSQTTSSINNLSAGIYTVTVFDQVGCSVVENFELAAPTPLNLIVDFNNPVCDGPSSGFAEVLQSEGGTGSYTFALNNNTFTSNPFFESLTEGSYEIQMMDANGCLVSVFENLEAPAIPEIDLGMDTTINLGEAYTFNPAFNNVDLATIIWTPADNFDCQECLNPSFVPLNTGAYTLVIVSEDECADSTSIQINVEKFRKFYAPTGFSPNFDGYNDYFTLYGGSEVEVIQKLTVFNRWGAVVFETRDVPASIDTNGWNGTFNGKSVNPDVYIWLAEIKFIDGEVISYSGDVTVLK